MLKISLCIRGISLLAFTVVGGSMIRPPTWAEEEWMAAPLADQRLEKLEPMPVKRLCWIVPHKCGPPKWATISSRRAKSGLNCLRLSDYTTNQASFANSQPISASPALPCRANVFVFNAKGTSRFYLEFFDKEHYRIARALKQASAVNRTPPQITLAGPLGAHTADVRLYSIIRETGLAFYDDCAPQIGDLKRAGFPTLEDGEKAIGFASRPQPFVDSRLIGHINGPKPKANSPVPREIVFQLGRHEVRRSQPRPDRPAELLRMPALTPSSTEV